VDPNNGQHNAYLYAGALYTGSGGHTFLVKHDLECESNCNTEQDIGTVPIGLAVDVDTSLVYVTTSEPNVAVYDCSTYPFICTYSTPTGGTESGPAGICVPTGDVSYKPPFPALTLTKVDNVNCVNLDDYVTYTISYDANGTAVSGVNIVDYLLVDFRPGAASGPSATLLPTRPFSPPTSTMMVRPTSATW